MNWLVQNHTADQELVAPAVSTALSAILGSLSIFIRVNVTVPQFPHL